MSLFQPLTVDKVIEHAQVIINEGRLSPIKIMPGSEPPSIINKLTSEDCARIDANALNMYRGISANNYNVRASLLWSSLFWKIGEQILIVADFNSPFSKFYQELEVGADIEEVAPRVKDGLDRQTLANSALFTNYVTQYDSFYHRINQFKVFATTYDQYEIARISNTWSNVTNMLNAELQNIILSASDWLHRHSKNALCTQYLSGGMDSISLGNITDRDSAETAAIAMNSAMDAMTIELTTDYIPFNRNSNNTDKTIRDIATSNLVLFSTADLLNNIHFRTSLNTYFGKEWQNDKFAGDVVKVVNWEQTISPDIQVTPGYTTLPSPGTILGFIAERNALIFRKKIIGTFSFDNVATLRTSAFHHLDCMADISDRRKVVALTV